MKEQATFSEVWEQEKPVEFDDTLEKRLDFVESICRDDDGGLVDNAEIHRIIQRKIFDWEQCGISRGMVRVPYGVGKSTQITQALNLYHLTLNPNHLIIILSGKPNNAHTRVGWIRHMIEHSSDYKNWCKKHGLNPLKLSSKDTNSSKAIYVERTSTSPHPSVFGSGVNEGGTGWRATRLTPDDIVDRKNSMYQKDREKVWTNWTNTWTKRVKPTGFIHGVFTPYHPKDANMEMIESGLYAELMMRVSEDKEHYEMFEKRPEREDGGTVLVDKDLEVPLWIEGGHDKQHYQDMQDENEVAYQRGYRMEEDVVEEGDKAYGHYSKEYYPDGNVTTNFDYLPGGATVYLAVDFNYNPQCWSLVQKQGNKHIVFAEIKRESMTTQKMAKETVEVLNDWGIRFVNIIGDATPRKGREGFNDYDTIKDTFSVNNIRYSIKTGASNPSVRNSITLLNKGLADTHGRRHLLIHDRCTAVKRDFRKVQRNEDGKIADKDSDLTHFSDGLRYYWWYMKKGRRKRTLPRLR